MVVTGAAIDGIVAIARHDVVVAASHAPHVEAQDMRARGITRFGGGRGGGRSPASARPARAGATCDVGRDPGLGDRHRDVGRGDDDATAAGHADIGQQAGDRRGDRRNDGRGDRGKDVGDRVDGIGDGIGKRAEKRHRWALLKMEAAKSPDRFNQNLPRALNPTKIITAR